MHSTIMTTLRELAEVVNSFKSEQVQVLITGKLLDHLLPEGAAPPRPTDRIKRSRGEGATYQLRLLVAGDYFNQPKTIGEITETLNQQQIHGHLMTSAVSGLILKLSREGKLIRGTAPSGRYTYVKPTNNAETE